MRFLSSPGGNEVARDTPPGGGVRWLNTGSTQESRKNSTDEPTNAKSTPRLGVLFSVGSVPVPFGRRGSFARGPSGLLREIVVDPCPALGPAAFATLLLAWLLEILAATHFLLHTGVLNQLTKPADCFLNGFIISQTQTNHPLLLFLNPIRGKTTNRPRWRQTSKGLSSNRGPILPD